MKVALKSISLVAACAVLLFYSGCNSKHPAPPSVTDQQIDLFTKVTTWTITAVTKDNVDQSADYSGVTFQFTGSKGDTKVGYALSGRANGKKYPWNSTGDLTFLTTSPATTLTRDDGTVVTYSLSSSQLNMSFNYSGAGYVAREQVVTGQWIFTLAPQ